MPKDESAAALTEREARASQELLRIVESYFSATDEGRKESRRQWTDLQKEILEAATGKWMDEIVSDRAPAPSWGAPPDIVAIAKSCLSEEELAKLLELTEAILDGAKERPMGDTPTGAGVRLAMLSLSSDLSRAKVKIHTRERMTEVFEELLAVIAENASDYKGGSKAARELPTTLRARIVAAAGADANSYRCLEITEGLLKRAKAAATELGPTRLMTLAEWLAGLDAELGAI
jgi:hypothetical protein